MACAYRDCDVVAAVATCAEVQSELDYAGRRGDANLGRVGVPQDRREGEAELPDIR